MRRDQGLGSLVFIPLSVLTNVNLLMACTDNLPQYLVAFYSGHDSPLKS